MLIITVSNYGFALGGQANNISVAIYYPDDTALVTGAHPTEITSGLYKYYFTTRVTGYHTVVATIQYESSSFTDSAVFYAKYDEYNNFSRVMEKMGTNIWLETSEQDHQTNIVVDHISANDIEIKDIINKVQELNDEDLLRNAAFTSLFQVTFTIIIFSFLIVVGNMVNGTRKTKQLLRATQPTVIAEKVAYPQPMIVDNRKTRTKAVGT